MARQPIASFPALLGFLLLAGCAPALSQVLTAPEDMLAQRRIQTKEYKATDEERILKACTALLQDMGFQIDEGTPRLGVILGSKMRDANSLTPGQRAGVAVVALGLLAGGYTAPLALLFIDKMHAQPVRIDVGIFTRRIDAEGSRVAVRIVFRETAYKDGRPALPQVIKDPAIYEDAFDRLSKTLFLEAWES